VPPQVVEGKEPEGKEPEGEEHLSLEKRGRDSARGVASPRYRRLCRKPARVLGS
jgi:hypothetical protein